MMYLHQLGSLHDDRRCCLAHLQRTQQTRRHQHTTLKVHEMQRRLLVLDKAISKRSSEWLISLLCSIRELLQLSTILI